MHPAAGLTSALKRTVGVALLIALATILAASGPFEAVKGTGPWAATGATFMVLALSPKQARAVICVPLALCLCIGLLVVGVRPITSVWATLMLVLVSWSLVVALSPIPGRYLNQLRSLGRFTLVGFVAALATGTISTLYALYSPAHSGITFAPVAASTLASFLLLSPLVLTTKRQGLSAHPAEVALQVGLLIAALATASTLPNVEALDWLPIPVLIWAAFRFGERILAFELAALYLTTTLLTAAAPTSPTSGNWVAEIYLILLFAISMPVALVSSERSDALRGIRLSARVFKQSYYHSQMPIALVKFVRGQLVFEDSNAAAERLLGTSSMSLPGQPVSGLVSLPNDMSKIVHEVLDGVRHGWEGHASLIDAHLSDLSLTLSLLDRHGSEPQFSLTIHDLSAESEVRAQLEEERNYNAAVLASSPCMILVTTPNGTIVDCNLAGAEMLGYTEDELVGHEYYDVLAPPEQREALKTAFMGDEPAPSQDETIMLTKSGERRLMFYRQAEFRSSTATDVLLVFTALDITEQRQISQLSQQLVDSATTVAFISTDLDGRVTLFNTGAETLLGYSSTGVTGHDFTDFLSPAAFTGYAASNNPTFADLVAHVVSGGIPETRDWTWIRAGGAAIRVSMTTSVVTDPFGHKPVGFLFVARDVSDARRSQEIVVLALKREREAVNILRALDRVKDDFISTVSHELRTPMTSIIGTTEMLEDELGGPLTDGQRSMLDIISRNGERLLTLADDLLLTAKLHANKEQQSEDPVDLRDVAIESKESIVATVNGRSIAMNIDLPSTPVMVTASHFHLERAISNLLSNAIKFSLEGGEVTLGVTIIGKEAIVEVSDNGIGIPRDELENVFDRFHRSPNAEENAIQGTGLGLSIVKSIVESHRGSIALTSELNKGTTVRLAFPLANVRVPVQPSGN